MKTYVTTTSYGHRGATSRAVVEVDSEGRVVTACETHGFTHPDVRGRVDMSGFQAGETIKPVLLAWCEGWLP